jgi:hypothetical protein
VVEEVPEQRREGLPLGEVVEVGPQHVLDVGRLPEQVRITVARAGE